MTWTKELNWAVQCAKRKTLNVVIYRMSLACNIYKIWLERNRKAFQGKNFDGHVLVKQIIQKIHARDTM